MATRTSFKDYYKALGVERTAGEQEIKQTYRRLARKYHPDVNPGDKRSEERFKEIQEAYDVLRDPAKRRKYDQFGTAYRQGGNAWQQAWEQAQREAQARGARGRPGPVRGGPEGEFDFGDVFGNLFGERFRPRGRWSGRPRAGDDIEQNVEVSLEEAFHGGMRVFQIQVPDESGSRRTERIEVRIPPGIPAGQRLRVAGRGHPGTGGGPRGDLYLKVQVHPHQRFERKDDDLRVEVLVPVWVAALGGDVDVDTIDGEGTFRIPPETQSGQRFRLTGHGMPHFRGGGRGDLYVRVATTVPKQLTQQERELFAELRRLRNGARAAAD